MQVVRRNQAVEEARSISSAASALLRAVESGSDGSERAAERLERRAASVLGDQGAGFQAAGGAADEVTPEDYLADSLTQLNIGLTLVYAEIAVSGPTGTASLGSAIAQLDKTADSVEAAGTDRQDVHRFDTRPDGTELTVDQAAVAALDEMAATAADVATSVLGKALKPAIEKLPKDLQSAVAKVNANLTGRFLGWGLRAVRRGLDLLLSLVDLPAIEQARDRIDSVLSQLGGNNDPAVFTGWAIGTIEVREALDGAGPDLARGGGSLVEELAQLAARYTSLGKLLKGIAAAIVALSAALAVLSVTLPHSLALTTAGLGLVLGAAIVLGRAYTGATPLPSSIRGVRLLVLDHVDAPA